MTRTKEDFVKRWRGPAMLLGMDALKVLNQVGPGQREAKAEALLNLPDQIGDLLSRMWEDLQPAPLPLPAKPAVQNGAPAIPQNKVTK